MSADYSIERKINEINSGIYCFNTDFLIENIDSLDTKNAQGEFYLTDLIGIANNQKQDIVIVQVDEDSIKGINSMSQLNEVEDIMQKKLIEDGQNKKSFGLHVHTPEAATPKDGPSAGAAMTLAIYSVLSGKKVNNKLHTPLGNFYLNKNNLKESYSLVVRSEGIKIIKSTEDDSIISNKRNNNLVKSPNNGRIIESKFLGGSTIVHLALNGMKDYDHLHIKIPGINYFENNQIVNLYTDVNYSYIFET